jgi:hypothetical protein
MDRAIWAVWYDLDDRDRLTFLSWLHETYLPALASTSAFAWVAHYQECEAPPQSERKPDGSLVIGHTREDMGNGHQYMVLVGADAPRRFLDPLFLTEESKVVEGAGHFLAQRRGIRYSLFVEQERVTGRAPGAADYPPMPGPAIQFGSFRLQSPEDEFEGGAWYSQDRLPLMARSVQCIRTRKLVSVAGWPKHGVIYEFTSIAARNELWESERKAKAAGAASSQGISAKTLHTPGSPVVATRTWPPVGDDTRVG